jgi:hypothetical protein
MKTRFNHVIANADNEKITLHEKLIRGYKAASEFSGLSEMALRRLVSRREIRCVKPSRNTVYFYPRHLAEDIELMEQQKLW